MTTEPSGAAVNFNIDKYKIKGENQNFTIKIKDDQFDVTVKPMTWKSKNDLVAKCMTFEPTGASSFDSGKYVKEVLKYIIVDAPWGKTTDEFLVQKKNPLVLPPDYEKLPKPINEKSLKKQQENEIDLSKVFENPEQTNSKNKTDINKSLEESIRKKIGND